MNENRKFGKVTEGGGIEYAPSPTVIDGVNVWTNIPEKYAEQGYLPVIKTEKPSKDGYYCTEYWKEEDGTVVQYWEEHETETAETVTEEEINRAIEEGVNGIDG